MEKLTITRRTFLKAAAVTGAAAAVFSPAKSPLKGLTEARTPAVQGQVERIRSACRACGKTECGVWVTVKDGRAVKIEGDDDCLTSEGSICSKAFASFQALYHPDRLKYPLKRTRPKGEDPGWVRISWDEALDMVAKKLLEIKEKYGGESIFGFAGTGRQYGGAGRATILGALGSPNSHFAGQVCRIWPRGGAARFTNWRTSDNIGLVEGVKVYVQWGSATEISNYGEAARVTVDRRWKADKHIVVGPRLQNLGKEADIWLPLRPGTDTAMALAWIDVIIKDRLYDKDFVQKWTNGPFLYCREIEPTGFTWGVVGNYPIDIKTRLLKESDIIAGGSVKKFMLWDEITKSLKYFDADAGKWEVEPPKIEPALFGSFAVTLKDGRKVEAKPVFQLLADRAAEYTPEKAEKITWVSADKIKEAARVYASRPGNGGIAAMLGLEQSANCTQNLRSIYIMGGITGNCDTPGGFRGGTTPSPFRSPSASPGAPTMPVAQYKKTLGVEKFPLLPWDFGSDATAIWDAVHTGKPYPLKAGFAQTGNFMNQTNSAYAWEALKKLDFFFMIDLWEVPMAGMADILVPCLHYLEQKWIRTSQGPHYGVGIHPGVVKPQWECQNELVTNIKLAEKMGIPWGKPPDLSVYPTEEELLDYSVKPMGLTWKEAVAKFQKDGWWNIQYLMPYKRYEVGALRADKKPGFALPTMKFEILSTILESYHPGHELPFHSEPPESPYARPDLVKDYPLILITGRRIPVYFHSEHRQLPWCRENWPVPLLEIHPETAAKLGIKQGDWVWIESPRGRVRQQADLYVGIDPRVVSAEHLWWYPECPAPEHGVQYSDINRIVDRYSQDPIVGATCMRGFPVKVYKAVEGAPPGIITSADDPRLKAWLPQYPEGGA
ncbi:MAG: twin-arginine translocation signal domain-containing protein [Chloroflexi bacterium]|nr:twin-arginine translocation signal domain-containing protein [Chloroflexota bacterium]